MRHILLAAAFLVIVAMASGCTSGSRNGLNESTVYEYDNVTVPAYNASSNSSSSNGNGRVAINDFTFKINGDNEYWLKANDSVKFDAVFNNADEYGEDHMYVARVFPSAVNFDVMAAFQCLHFTTCGPLLEHMRLMFQHPQNSTFVRYAYVGLYPINITVPGNTPSGTYMFNMVSCRDMKFGDCLENTTNFGPNIPIIVHVP